MSDDPIEEVVEHISGAARTLSSTGMYAASMAAQTVERRARQAADAAHTSRLSDIERRRAMEHAERLRHRLPGVALVRTHETARDNAARVREGVTPEARKWLNVVAATAGAEALGQVWESRSWPALLSVLDERRAKGWPTNHLESKLGAAASRVDFDDLGGADAAAEVLWSLGRQLKVPAPDLRTPKQEAVLGDDWEWADDGAILAGTRAGNAMPGYRPPISTAHSARPTGPASEVDPWAPPGADGPMPGTRSTPGMAVPAAGPRPHRVRDQRRRRGFGVGD